MYFLPPCLFRSAEMVAEDRKQVNPRSGSNFGYGQPILETIQQVPFVVKVRSSVHCSSVSQNGVLLD